VAGARGAPPTRSGGLSATATSTAATGQSAGCSDKGFLRLVFNPTKRKQK